MRTVDRSDGHGDLCTPVRGSVPRRVAGAETILAEPAAETSNLRCAAQHRRRATMEDTRRASCFVHDPEHAGEVHRSRTSGATGGKTARGVRPHLHLNVRERRERLAGLQQAPHFVHVYGRQKRRRRVPLDRGDADHPLEKPLQIPAGTRGVSGSAAPRRNARMAPTARKASGPSARRG